MKRAFPSLRPPEKKPRLVECLPRYKAFQDTCFSSNLHPLPHVLKGICTFLLSPEEAMVEAASTNQLGWLNSLVKQYDAHVSDAVLLAARIGDIKSLELLTPYMDELKDVKREAFEEVVLAASKSGNADVVRLLLPELGGEGLAWSVIKIAAGKGFMEILSFAADAAECGYEMSYVLLHAIHSRQSEAAIFLASRYYREWNLGEGLESALVYGLNEVAECIYGVITREGQETSFHEFFVYLGGDGYSHALMYLYRRGHNDPKLLGLALDDAARGGQINVLRMLVNTGRITQDRIGETLWTTVRFGKGSSVEFLVNNSNISTEAMNRAFEDASKIEISKFLYTKLSNPAEFVVTAFRNAAGCGRYTWMSDKERVAIVKFLRSTGFVPDKLVCDAFTVAIEKWYTEGVVLTLCNEACISPEIAIEAFQKAVSVGKTKVMKLLMSKHGIALSIKEKAMISAAQSGRSGVVEVLCASEDWSLDALNKAISATTDAAALAILQAKKTAKAGSLYIVTAK